MPSTKKRNDAFNIIADYSTSCEMLPPSQFIKVCVMFLQSKRTVGANRCSPWLGMLLVDISSQIEAVSPLRSRLFVIAVLTPHCQFMQHQFALRVIIAQPLRVANTDNDTCR